MMSLKISGYLVVRLKIVLMQNNSQILNLSELSILQTIRISSRENIIFHLPSLMAFIIK